MKTTSCCSSRSGSLSRGCASVVPLGNVARRTADPRSLAQDVTVDATRRELAGVKRIAWAAYSVTFDCEDDAACGYTRPSARRSRARSPTHELPSTASCARRSDRRSSSAFLRPRPRRRRSVGKSRLARFARRCHAGFRSSGLKRAKAPVSSTAKTSKPSIKRAWLVGRGRALEAQPRPRCRRRARGPHSRGGRR